MSASGGGSRPGSALFAETLFPVDAGVVARGGLVLRDGRLLGLPVA